jgi:hypothetical protein
VTDPPTIASCAKWLRALADAMATASQTAEAPAKRGPGRPRKTSVDEETAGVSDGNGTPEALPATLQSATA